MKTDRLKTLSLMIVVLAVFVLTLEIFGHFGDYTGQVITLLLLGTVLENVRLELREVRAELRDIREELLKRNNPEVVSTNRL